LADCIQGPKSCGQPAKLYRRLRRECSLKEKVLCNGAFGGVTVVQMIEMLPVFGILHHSSSGGFKVVGQELNIIGHLQ
jgi:hypothetical protein